MHVPLHEFRYYSNESSEWILEHGTYCFYVGSSSDVTASLSAAPAATDVKFPTHFLH